MTRLNNYFFDLEIAISKILTRKRSVTLAYDILDTDKTRKNKKIKAIHIHNIRNYAFLYTMIIDIVNIYMYHCFYICRLFALLS
jgi:hypothetical protein